MQMQKSTYTFSRSVVDYFWGAGPGQLKKVADPRSSVMITDENIYKAHPARFRGWNTIVLKPGEDYKVQSTVDALIDQLIRMETGRDHILVGVGGGVITDLTGYVASIYMRGLRFGFIPTSILGLVDASIGGKNGIDVGEYKNMLGTIRQPSFILQDLSFLDSLPMAEWENGFAEIIKHACIRDAAMFAELEKSSIKTYRENKKRLAALLQRNALLKTRLVRKDEFEKGERRLLNFGHTLGHALENQYELMHGQAVAIGMTFAAHVSAQLTGFSQTERLVELLGRYRLPAYASFNKQKVFRVLKMDKKRARKNIHYVALEKIGKAVIVPVSLQKLESFIRKY